MISIKYIVKELLAQRTRLVLTILAIAWGTATIVCMLAIGEGLRQQFSMAMSSAGKNIMIVEGGQTTVSYKGSPINEQVKLTQTDLSSVRHSVLNAMITPEYNLTGKLTVQGKTSTQQLSAVQPMYGEMRNISVMPGGRFISSLDEKQRQRVIVLGFHVAENLFGSDADPVGQKLLFAGNEFTVIGVTATKIQFWSYQMPDDYLAWIPASTYAMFKPNADVSRVIIMPDSAANAEKIKQSVRNVIALNHHISTEDDGAVIIQDSSEMQEKTNNFFLGMQVFLGIVGTLTLIVAGVGISNVMLVAVRRSQREIGIRMAVGARSYQVLLHYIAEGLLTTLVGGVIGFLVSEVIIFVLGSLPMPAEFTQIFGHLRPVLSLTTVFVVISILGVIGLAAGFFPARKAALVNPVEALRHE